jgi:5'-3' exoribonuclease 2
MDVKFDLGQPFKPFEQLMAVFPAARYGTFFTPQLTANADMCLSRKHIPPTFQPLMVDENSPIIDFYPTTFEIDMNGKRMAWQGVALLPFIDEKRLLDAMAPEYPKITEEEVRRNRWGNNLLFVSDQHGLYPYFERLYGKKKRNEVRLQG